jgi:hypothetical protein
VEFIHHQMVIQIMQMNTQNVVNKLIYIIIIIPNNDVEQLPIMMVQPHLQLIFDSQPFSKKSSVLIIKHLHLVSKCSEIVSDEFLFCLVRNDASLYEQRKNSSKIIADLTTHSADEQLVPSPHKLQTQLSVQDTIQRHFSLILKNDSLTVTDNTTITETILMRENSSSTAAATLSMLILLEDQSKIRF